MTNVSYERGIIVLSFPIILNFFFFFFFFNSHLYVCHIPINVCAVSGVPYSIVEYVRISNCDV